MTGPSPWDIVIRKPLDAAAIWAACGSDSPRTAKAIKELVEAYQKWVEPVATGEKQC